MFFLLRAALVIGAIVYLSPLRDRAAPAAALPTQADALRTAGQLAAALPAPMREAALHAGGEAMLRGALAPAAPSRDTLHAADRHVPWQGTAPR